MKTISIPAATNGSAGVYSERVSGSVFSCIAATGPFRVQLGNEAPQTGYAGLVIGDGSSKQLGTLTFTNAGTSAVDVTFEAGTQPYKGATPAGSVENFLFLPTFGNAGSVGGTRALPTGNGATIAGSRVINGVSKTRQFIEITNLSGADLIYVFTSHLTGGNLDQCIGIVFPNSFRRFEVSQDLVLGNISLNTIQCTAYEQY